MGCLPSGEESVKAANAERYRERCAREFEAFRRERLASGELECRKLITAAQQHLTEVRAATTSVHRPSSCSFRACARPCRGAPAAYLYKEHRFMPSPCLIRLCFSWEYPIPGAHLLVKAVIAVHHV